jgi:hypothetical protein
MHGGSLVLERCWVHNAAWTTNKAFNLFGAILEIIAQQVVASYDMEKIAFEDFEGLS